MADYETLHVCRVPNNHDANNVSTFGGDPVTQLHFKTRFKKVMRDLQRRSSILLESARDRVTSASKTVCDRVTAMERPARKTVQLILDLLIFCKHAVMHISFVQYHQMAIPASAQPLLLF